MQSFFGTVALVWWKLSTLFFGLGALLM